ncbi:MAG: hypothetical protein R3255_07220, partial [Candidatus Lokiarchaeia archaeon]|nr:hypothetical protein [Candidatus Lokiarchaeia archaeon]
MINFEMEGINLEELEEGIRVIKLPELTEEEKEIINPIVAPTSGLRIQLLELHKKEEKEFYILTKKKFFLFLRMFKAISIKYKELK